MAVSNPFVRVKTIYSPQNMFKSLVYYGLMGTVSEVKLNDKCDWAIELFLGTIWKKCNGKFGKFVKELSKSWLHEYLHMVYRWERGKLSMEKAPLLDRFYAGSLYEERIVKRWVRLLTKDF